MKLGPRLHKKTNGWEQIENFSSIFPKSVAFDLTVEDSNMTGCILMQSNYIVIQRLLVQKSASIKCNFANIHQLYKNTPIVPKCIKMQQLHQDAPMRCNINHVDQLGCITRCHNSVCKNVPELNAVHHTMIAMLYICEKSK